MLSNTACWIFDKSLEKESKYKSAACIVKQFLRIVLAFERGHGYLAAILRVIGEKKVELNFSSNSVGFLFRLLKGSGNCREYLLLAKLNYQSSPKPIRFLFSYTLFTLSDKPSEF